MSELKRITAPALGSGFGENIQSTFANIDANFGVLANQELYKGDPGKDLIHLTVLVKDMVGENPASDNYNPYFEASGYHIKKQYNNIYNALKSIDPSDPSNPDTEGDQKPIILSQLNDVENSDEIVICIDEDSQNPGYYDIISTMPYVVIDKRFKNPEDVSRITGAIDMSCVLATNGTNSWVAPQPFPTLYYNSTEGQLYWKINGSNTKIPAQGPQGLSGRDGNFYIGYFNTTPDNNRVVVAEILNGTGIWEAPSEQNVISGSPIFIFDYNQTTLNNDGIQYYVSNIYKSDQSSTYYSIVSGNNNCYITVGKGTFATILENITYNDAELPGLFLKIGATNDYWMLSVDASGILNINIKNKSNNTWSDSSVYHPVKITSELIQIGAHAEGQATTASGQYSHAEGSRTTASGILSHVEGDHTKASGAFSHAEGYKSETGGTATSNTLTASATTSSGYGAHAEGDANIARGSFSHVEGQNTYAIGKHSHAEGFSSSAGSYGSDPSLYGGDYSHAEGVQTLTKGTGSHAEGWSTTASGTASHAEGCYTIAKEDYSHAEGYYNAPGFAGPGDVNIDYIRDSATEPYTDPIIFSIGCGTSNTYSGSGHRQNALFVTKNGNVWVLNETHDYTYMQSGTGSCDTYKKIN